MGGDSEGGWSQVKRKGRRLRHVPNASAVTVNDEVSKADGLRPNPSPEYSINDLLQYHKKVKQKFDESNCWLGVRERIDSVASKKKLPTITKAICLGTGPYDPADGSSQARRTAHVQTAAFCAVVDHLRAKGEQDIKCYIQEPRFTQVDKEFCAKLSLEAIDSPDGFYLIDQATLVFAIHLELEFCNLALKVSPAAFIGTGLDEWLRVVDASAEKPGPLIRFFELEATHHKSSFPDVDFIFSSTSIYLRNIDENISKAVEPEESNSK
ncbi:hypothetical protein QBC38DRAFT_277064 [Podospora fimiseda]|uniref:SRR1-like domain-containing protein n=1 Tax=Podospora fimiseda TaxID=252190 RepID=A0AAN7BX94_9PEZI|nr:hypothetical protein QBC38DRAFT_277064 [Podospora fimiseda]